MSELRELYQELILDHNKNPRNFHEMDDHTHAANGHNPLCGDKLKLFLKVDDEVIVDIAFIGSGCAISKSSASLMTSFLKGRTIQEARRYFETFHDLVTGETVDAESLTSIGKLAVFQGVQEFPARVKCASLSWHTLMAAIDESNDTVKTE